LRNSSYRLRMASHMALESREWNVLTGYPNVPVSPQNDIDPPGKGQVMLVRYVAAS
jgi:hypothetical protein